MFLGAAGAARAITLYSDNAFCRPGRVASAGGLNALKPATLRRPAQVCLTMPHDALIYSFYCQKIDPGLLEPCCGT